MEPLLRFAPDAPGWTPTPESVEQAIRTLHDLFPEADEIRAESFGRIAFVDPGCNLEGVFCPRCGAELGDAWHDRMDRAFSNGFEDLRTVLPCCDAECSLADLEYRGGGAAFGSFVLEVRRPNASPATPTPEGRAMIERALGSRVIVVDAIV